jgi:hypothetical protein
LEPAACTPDAQQQQQQQQQGPADGTADATGSEEEGEREEKEAEQEQKQCSLQVLTAAALFGGWWGPAAEPAAGKGSKLALQLIEGCLGDAVAQAVQAILK